MNHPFSPEQVQELAKNPYVLSVSQRLIKFTTEFKELAYEELLKGKTMREIFKENGLDPEILGETRVYSFTNNLKQKALNDGSFEDRRRFNKHSLLTDNEEIRLLRHEVEYLRQEVEFLKKTQKADMEARKRWEFALQHRKNSE